MNMPLLRSILHRWRRVIFPFPSHTKHRGSSAFDHEAYGRPSSQQGQIGNGKATKQRVVTAIRTAAAMMNKIQGVDRSLSDTPEEHTPKSRTHDVSGFGLGRSGFGFHRAGVSSPSRSGGWAGILRSTSRRYSKGFFLCLRQEAIRLPKIAATLPPRSD